MPSAIASAICYDYNRPRGKLSLTSACVIIIMYIIADVECYVKTMNVHSLAVIVKRLFTKPGIEEM